MVLGIILLLIILWVFIGLISLVILEVYTPYDVNDSYIAAFSCCGLFTTIIVLAVILENYWSAFKIYEYNKRKALTNHKTM